MRVVGIQHDIVWEDAAATRALLRPKLAQAAAIGARLVVLPEMFATGFSMNSVGIAELEGGPTEQFLLDAARAENLWIVGSIAQYKSGNERVGKARNVAVLVGPAGQVHRYDKLHPFTITDEHVQYEGGDKHVTVDVEGLRVSLFVCYDLRFADEFWAVAHDTDLYVVVANWPAARREHWRTLLAARAIENQAYVVGVNRVGTVAHLNYLGDSVIIDPMGRRLSEAAYGEALIDAEVDPAEVARVRSKLPFLQDRR